MAMYDLIHFFFGLLSSNQPFVSSHLHLISASTKKPEIRFCIIYFFYTYFFSLTRLKTIVTLKKKKDDRLWYRGSYKMGTLGSILNPELGVFGPDDKKKIALV